MSLNKTKQNKKIQSRKTVIKSNVNFEKANKMTLKTERLLGKGKNRNSTLKFFKSYSFIFCLQ